MSEPIWICSNVSVQFGGLKAVNNVTMALREHEFVGLIGPNGAGKTTIFNLVTGSIRPTEGQITVRASRSSACPPTSSVTWASAARSRTSVSLRR